ncbi:hypothetical protein A5gp_00080 [Alteromonas phage vB_AemP_PT15-A5]|nr:hypothetical protein A5gp_00080 [Alteromonas phage vB_AemP_PT15-A5]
MKDEYQKIAQFFASKAREAGKYSEWVKLIKLFESYNLGYEVCKPVYEAYKDSDTEWFKLKAELLINAADWDI